MTAISKILVPGLLLAASAAVMADSTLKVGSPAPPLKVAKWIKGSPVKSFKPGEVYVVEFWATWCGPCKQSIPHLTELAKKYKGKATFTGVSVWEEKNPTTTKYMDKVASFVKEWDKKMEYNVAVDGMEGTMSKTWMEAAGQGGIPSAFVIDQRGTVVWIGHPMGDLDRVVGEVIDGKFDAKAEADKEARAKEEYEKANAFLKPFQQAMKDKKFAQAVIEADKIIADNPAMEEQMGMGKFHALLMSDEATAYAYGKKLAAGVYKDSPMALNSLAWSIVDDKSTVKKPDFNAAIEFAQRAVDASKAGDPMLAYVLDTLAYAHFKAGNVDKAIEVQVKAVAVAEKTADFDAETLKEIKGRLETFKKKKGG